MNDPHPVKDVEVGYQEFRLLRVLVKDRKKSWGNLSDPIKDILVDNGYTPAKYNQLVGRENKGEPLANPDTIVSLGLFGTVGDTLAFLLNTAYTLPADVLSLIYPPAYSSVLGVYQIYSVVPNTISTFSMISWAGQGLVTGDNYFDYHVSESNAAFSISISLDTAVAVGTNVAGWTVLRDPNIATAVDGIVANYDYMRYNSIPSVPNLSVSLNTSAGWQIYIGR